MNDLSFEVRESSRRRTLGIAVERDGSLTLLVPQGTPDETLRHIVQQKRFWVYQKLASKALQSSPTVGKPFINGQGFYYLGRSHRLLLSNVHEGPALRLHQGRFVLRQDAIPTARTHFINWYKNLLLPRVQEEVARIAPRLEVEPKGVQIRELGHRWGSCSPDGRINIHWRVALLPMKAVTYVVAHELSHLVESRHNERFWRLVDRLVPDFETRKQWLAVNGSIYSL